MITAKNEEKGIGQCLDSIVSSVALIENLHNIYFDVIAVLDDCIDNTESIVRTFSRIKILKSSGGIVKAQRKAYEATNADFIIFSDADIYVEAQALLAIAEVMLKNSNLRIAYPLKHPVKTLTHSILAKALYVYNKHNGFQTKRHYFNGRLFAIRGWFIPSVEELQETIQKLPRCKFYSYEEGIRTDDIFLSRFILNTYGRDAISEITSGVIFYRPPETYRGMYRTYRRMRMEIERLNHLLPETIPAHQRSGIRQYDSQAIKNAKFLDVFYWYIFRCALQICKVHYVIERFWFQHFATRRCPAWETIEESKLPIHIEL
ncbi:MAG: glycosyltransferase [Pseudomonadota bacterium]